ncbi:hypothetical protein GBA52_009954 [Prunus armeniaca]|nr:hypothetical protein GBA52_009954 [Prunus armeniaca]
MCCAVSSARGNSNSRLTRQFLFTKCAFSACSASLRFSRNSIRKLPRSWSMFLKSLNSNNASLLLSTSSSPWM